MRVLLASMLLLACGEAPVAALDRSPCEPTHAACEAPHQPPETFEDRRNLEACSASLGGCVGAESERTGGCDARCPPAFSFEKCQEACLREVLKECSTLECVEELTDP